MPQVPPPKKEQNKLKKYITQPTLSGAMGQVHDTSINYVMHKHERLFVEGGGRGEGKDLR